MKLSDQALETVSQVLIRSTIMGFILIFWWGGCLQLAGDFCYKMHSCLIPSIPEPHFHLVHYIGIMTTKLVIMVVFLIPFIAIKLVLKKRRDFSESSTLANGS